MTMSTVVRRYHRDLLATNRCVRRGHDRRAGGHWLTRRTLTACASCTEWAEGEVLVRFPAVGPLQEDPEK